MLALLPLLLAPVFGNPASGTEVPGTEAHYLDASLDLDGRLLSWQVLDLEGDGESELILAIANKTGERELRVHRLTGGGLERSAKITVPILPDVVAWSAADVRAEPGRELVFLTRSGAWSYSLTLPGYRDNVARLASVELIYDMPDPRALPHWAYVLRQSAGRDQLLLPGRTRLSIWGPPEEGDDPGYQQRATLATLEVTHAVDAIAGDASRRGDGPRVRVEQTSPFLKEALDGGSSLLEDAHRISAPAMLDMDGDGHLDLVTSDGKQLMFFMGGSAGPSSEPTRVEALPEPLADEEQEVQLHLRDVNGDGRVDVVAVTAAQAEGLSNRVFRVLVYHAGAQGLFGEQPAQVLRFEAGGLEAQVVDVDDDGHMDLAIEKIELPSLVGAVTGIEVKFSHLVFPGGARGIARKPLLSYEERHDEDSAIDLAVSRTLSHDCDGDGMADVVAIDLAGEITIRRVRAQESRLRGATWKLDPAPWKRFDVGGSIESLRVADYNGDGLGDIVSAGEDRLTVLLSVRQGRGR